MSGCMKKVGEHGPKLAVILMEKVWVTLLVEVSLFLMMEPGWRLELIIMMEMALIPDMFGYLKKVVDLDSSICGY
jgi:hypothetical protein